MPTAGIAVFSASIDLLSVLLKFNAFSGIQKALMDWTTAEHQTATMTFFGESLALGSTLELLGATS